MKIVTDTISKQEFISRDDVPNSEDLERFVTVGENAGCVESSCTLHLMILERTMERMMHAYVALGDNAAARCDKDKGRKSFTTLNLANIKFLAAVDAARASHPDLDLSMLSEDVATQLAPTLTASKKVQFGRTINMVLEKINTLKTICHLSEAFDRNWCLKPSNF